MRELTIGKNDAGQRVDRFVSKALPLLPPALLQKYIRLKRIKVNGGRAQRDQRLQEGDVLQLYINDEFFDKPREDNLFLTLFRPSLDIVYEDENLMLLNKRPGLVVHADETEKVNTLINHIQAYLYQKREWNPRWENAFTPALCNRIDRNTGGIVIAAKNAETLRIINQKIRDREIDKRYLCITVGAPRPPQGEVSCFLLKDEKKKQVAAWESNRENFGKADYYLGKMRRVHLQGVQGNDPEVIEYLEGELADLEAAHQSMKEANAYYRKHKTLEGCPGIDQKTLDWLTRPGVFACGDGSPLALYRCPFPTYALTNNLSNIKRTRERLEALKAARLPMLRTNSTTVTPTERTPRSCACSSFSTASRTQKPAIC